MPATLYQALARLKYMCNGDGELILLYYGGSRLSNMAITIDQALSSCPQEAGGPEGRYHMDSNYNIYYIDRLLFSLANKNYIP